MYVCVSYLTGSLSGQNPLVKKGSFNISSEVGLVMGLGRSSLVINTRASFPIREGMWYSFRLIFRYVSFKLLVSKGGLPTNKVYLVKNQYQLVCLSIVLLVVLTVHNPLTKCPLRNCDPFYRELQEQYN